MTLREALTSAAESLEACAAWFTSAGDAEHAAYGASAVDRARLALAEHEADGGKRCFCCGAAAPWLGVAADAIPEHLAGFANQMAARFGRPVYLVGSALREREPRDWDVRIVLSNDEWAARYGDVNEYEVGHWLPYRYPSLNRYYVDMAKLSRSAANAARANVDFQVDPWRFGYRFRDQPRRRLDTLGDALEDLFLRHAARSADPPTAEPT